MVAWQNESTLRKQFGVRRLTIRTGTDSPYYYNGSRRRTLLPFLTFSSASGRSVARGNNSCHISQFLQDRRIVEEGSQFWLTSPRPSPPTACREGKAYLGCQAAWLGNSSRVYSPFVDRRQRTSANSRDWVTTLETGKQKVRPRSIPRGVQSWIQLSSL